MLDLIIQEQKGILMVIILYKLNTSEVKSLSNCAAVQFHQVFFNIYTVCEAGCSQEEGTKKGFVMGSRTQGVQEILEKYIYDVLTPTSLSQEGWDTWSRAIQSCFVQPTALLLTPGMVIQYIYNL